MAGGTKAQSADLRATATDIDRLDEETQNELRVLKGEAEELRNSNWRSMRSGKSFDQTMMQWNQDAATMRAALQEIARLMRSTADRYENQEHENASAVQIMSGDGMSFDLGR
jgi:WXG100 family type VII secretion target